MFKMLGAAVAAACLLVANPASATRYITFDFHTGTQAGQSWTEGLYTMSGGTAVDGRFHVSNSYAGIHCCGPVWDNRPPMYLISLVSITLQSDYDMRFINSRTGAEWFLQGSPEFQTIKFAPGDYWGIGYLTLGDNLRRPYVIDSVSFTAVPEPATWAMMIVGFGGAGSLIRRQVKAPTPNDGRSPPVPRFST